MGLIDHLASKRVYVDTNIFIYLIEGNETYQAQILELAEALSNGRFEAITSHITLTELLPPLVKRGDEKILTQTLTFMTSTDAISLVPLGAEISIQAGFLRGEVGMKTPDALHVATAIDQNCEVFLTNDAGIRVVGDLERILLSEFS